MNVLWLEREPATTDAARLIQRHEAETRLVLARLAEVGLVEQLRAAYTRQGGFEAIQQEQVVMHYTQRHGSVSVRRPGSHAVLAGSRLTVCCNGSPTMDPGAGRLAGSER